MDRNNRKSFPLLLLAAIACSATPVALAQYVGPNATPPQHSVADILARPVDEQRVTLNGFLVRQVTDDTYVFSDGGAEIQVEIDTKLFPPTPVDDKTRVLIRGEVEKDMMQSPEIDVDHIEIVP